MRLKIIIEAYTEISDLLSYCKDVRIIIINLDSDSDQKIDPVSGDKPFWSGHAPECKNEDIVQMPHPGKKHELVPYCKACSSWLRPDREE